jgi:hypothetical protein
MPLLLLFCLVLAGPLATAGSADPLVISAVVPVKNQEIYAADTLVAGVTWDERVRIDLANPGDRPLTDLKITVSVPLGMPVSVPTQPLVGVTAGNGTVSATIPVLAPGEVQNVSFGVRPPASIEYRTSAPFVVTVSYLRDGTPMTATATHEAAVVPPFSWITYATIGISIVALIGALAVFRRSNLLERFTTSDLITIALIAALMGVVFRWFWQTFNDLLGPLGGLLFTIPTAVLLVLALHLVRKPGTATVLFFVEQVVAMIVWGSNILLWLGWYLIEGVAVDLIVLALGQDYADRRSTAVLLGVTRGVVSYGAFYFLFAPAVWHVAYAPWYSLLQVGIAVFGGIVGGWIGYSTAVKVRGAL